MGNSSSNLVQIRKRTIAERDQKLDKYLPIFRGILKNYSISNDRIQRVTRMDLTQLVNQLNNNSITSEQLVAIYGERACTIGKNLSLVTDQYFDYALKKAKECDQERKTTKKMNWTMQDQWNMQKFFPPLYGIPTSIKQNIEMKGTHSTIGVTIRATRVDKEDCATIKCIKHSGMIPFIKTNLPQLAFNFDTNNFLWGRTLNPWNVKKSPGGSSGGQGAALSARVSPIGIGNDMGGSIRIPAAFCGVFGLMPSQRLPFWGQITKYSTSFSGLDRPLCTNGPLGTSIDSLVLWMRNMTTEQFYQGEHDVTKRMVPLDIATYKEYAESKKKYRIGYLQSFQLIEPTTACRRAVKEAVSFLKSQGHEVIEFTVPNERELLFSMFTELLGEGDFQTFQDVAEGQELVQEYHQVNFMANRGWCMFNCILCILQKKYPRLGMALQASRRRSTHQFLQHIGRLHQLQQEFFKEWRKQKLDFLVFPGFGSEATSHGSSKDGSLLASYTFIFNLLRMTVCSQPITVTKEDELVYQSDWQDPVTELIRNNLKDAVGMPVSIQIAGLPFSEEKVLGLSKRIEQHFKFYSKHPLPEVS